MLGDPADGEVDQLRHARAMAAASARDSGTAVAWWNQHLHPFGVLRHHPLRWTVPGPPWWWVVYLTTTFPGATTCARVGSTVMPSTAGEAAS